MIGEDMKTAVAKEIYRSNNLSYHNWDHVTYMISEYSRIKKTLLTSKKCDIPWSEDIDKDVMTAIIWHDVIYVPGAKDNEQKSAELYKLHNHIVGRDLVYELIMCTKRHIPNFAYLSEVDEGSAGIYLMAMELICDLDLAALGDTWEIYRENGIKIREEFKGVPDDVFKKGRINFLESLLNRQLIYRTGFYYEREQKAIDNIKKDIYLMRKLGLY